MKEPEFLEEDGEDEEDFLDEEVESDGEEDFAFLNEEDDGEGDFTGSAGQRSNRVNARRALEDYFEEKLRREEENYFDEFSIPLDED